MGKPSPLSVKGHQQGRHDDRDRPLPSNVAPAGTKSWVQGIVIYDRRRDIGLGSYTAVALAQARSLEIDVFPHGFWSSFRD